MAAVKQQPQQSPNAWSDNNSTPRMILRFSGGLNEQTDPDINECSVGQNFVLGLNQQSLVPRQPFDLRATTPNAAAINGVMQLTTRAGASTTLVQAGTKIYLWDGATTFNDKATVSSSSFLRETYWSLGDYLIISDVNLSNVLLTWDGSSVATMTHTGISGSLYAKFAVVHLNRVWLFNIKIDSASYPHMILACEFEDPTNWDNAARGGATTEGGDGLTTGLEAFYLFTKDLKAINGVTFFQNTLIISTDLGKVYQLTGTSSKDFQFVDFFDTEPAIGVGQIASVGNDVLYLRRGGKLSLLFATQTYGNANLADLSMWLPHTTDNLSQINAIVYDTNNQRVYIFIPNKVLVLFKNVLQRDRYQVKAGMSPWSVYITDDDSQFNTHCGAYILDPGTTSYNVFFGDSHGRIFAMHGGGNGDAGSIPVRVMRRSRHIGPEVIQNWPWSTENITGHLRYRRDTPIDVTVSLEWDDEYNTGSNVVRLKGPTYGQNSPAFGGSYYFNGTGYFNQGFDAVSRVSSMSLSPGGKGPGFYLTVSTPTRVPFQVDSIEFD